MTKKIFLGLFAALLLAGCGNMVDQNPENQNPMEYGSLVLQSTARALDKSSIKSAVVIVTGNGMGAAISKSTNEISDGSGSVEITGIPVGKNRIISVYAYSDLDGQTEVQGAVIRAVVDINPGVNTLSAVNWETSKKGYVYNALFERGVDVRNLSAAQMSAIENSTPDVHAVLIDTDLFAGDYGTDGSGLRPSSNYILKAGSVTVTATNVNGCTLKINDPLSSDVTVNADGSVTIPNVAPGEWTMSASKDSDTATATVIVAENNATPVSVTYGSGTSLAGKTIVFVKSSSAPDLWAWEDDSGVELSRALGGTWRNSSAATLMTPATSDYMAEPSGWYMMDFTSVRPSDSTKTIKFKLNWDAAKTGLATTFWYDSSASGVNPSPVASGLEITPTNPSVPVKPSISISPSGGTVSTTGKITVTLGNGNSTITSASVTAKCGSTTKTYAYSDFTGDVLDINVGDLTEEDAKTITVSASATNAKGTTYRNASLTSQAVQAVKIYVSANSAPTIWAWNAGNTNLFTGSEAYPGPTMTPATGMNNPEKWFVVTLDPAKITPENTDPIKIIVNGTGGDLATGKTKTFWYDALGLCGAANTYYDSDPTTPPDPVKPTVTITPASGKVSTKGSISVSFTNGFSTITSATVTINGQAFDMGTEAGTFTKTLESLGITGDNIPISVAASVTNGVGTTNASASLTSRYVDPSKVDTFTWDNVNAYFVLTDRFHNGDTKNDYSYYRTNSAKNPSIPNVATFHGGDIKGLTDKLDYLDTLGVNAIWLTAPYEQIHGWVTGGGSFPHFSFHGYYALDWTFMDQNMGTIEEFRTFVTEAHRRGIRIVMDVVMNHTGYNTIEDMITYGFGSTTVTDHGWVQGGPAWDNNHAVTDYNSENWSKWWSGWARGFEGKFGFASVGGGDLQMSLAGLPDVVTESTTTVSIPTFLRTKWNAELGKTTVVSAGNTTGNSFVDYQLPSIANVDWYNRSGDWRADSKGAPADYIIMWLSAWVREFGIDGFRCDTAKHVDMYRWGQLKDACQSALLAWRADSSKVDESGAKDWEQNFWMTGECFGWTSTSGQGDYYTTGKFDSMINFSFNGTSGGSGSTPTESAWSSYLSINSNADSDGNGNRNSVLSYVSSHDTGLHRPSDQKLLGTRLVLLPGGVQIYYGDESARPGCDGQGDKDMITRGDMNFGQNTDVVAHWGKLGTFRKYNPAVGAGTGSATKRSYSGPAGESKVAIGVSGATVNVQGLFENGTTVYNWYDGASATVSGESVTFNGGTGSVPILVSDKNPATFGVTF